MADISGIEVVVPYGNANGSLHLRFDGDYRTFCGRECDGWPVAEGKSFRAAMDSAYICKRCRAAALK